MNKLNLLICCFLALCLNVAAQSPDTTKDIHLMDELEMTKYDKDPSADAVILSDVGNIFLGGSYAFEKYFDRTVKIKILSEAGISNGTLEIPLYTNGRFNEFINYIVATTYNLEDGKISSTSFNKNTMYEEKYSGYLSTRKIAMPNVKVGSVIIISYGIRSPSIGYFNWSFQHNIPVAHSVFHLIKPPFLHYMSLMQNIDTSAWIYFERKDSIPNNVLSNYQGMSGTNKYQDAIYTYAYNDVPAFKEEAFIPNKQDYIIQIGFQLSKSAVGQKTFTNTWEDFTNHLLLDVPAFGGFYYSKEHYMDKTIEQLNLSGKPEKEKIKTIVNYVKTNYKWSNYYSYLADKEMEDFITQKTGNSADLNLFLTALLKAANIGAKPVLISTREHGKIKANYPFYNFFNDVVCYVKTDSLSLLLDATEPALPYFVLPPQCTNGFGYVVQKDDSEWVDLKPRMAAKTMETMFINLSKNYDSINCKFTIMTSGYSGYTCRKEWNEGYDKFSSQLTRSNGMEINDSVKIYSLDNPEEPLFIKFSASLPALRQKTDSAISGIIFSPFLNEPLHSNPLTMPDRKYPVDMDYPRDFKYQAVIVIPAGYKLHEKPAETNYSLTSNNASYSYKIKQISDNTIQFTSDLSFNVGVFQPSEYKELQSLYDMAIKKCKEPIILDKKL
ncbi:MAG TPA: transglutaminase domain-containing protein [Bacteroidia bacterium]|jgi:hypothetical protein|nr:transglutaminase domain-containing protein [Bacteroidia bacterium]